mmetsp:Transcript_10270/g.28868  ORF Transcript_10270/g.28868 Transcript_10270/m.28868 type:complete len:433 (+) Transcript_10270:166-1464(+)|eukprot:CAMPEP_0119133516 /NCGR_PEP_ID=MMETSP1310-20130426/13415_1 /TAXON_ID=464262 /ORGANISM="Genus nov. species nov., Strain RCC2339" /LENGTH=432 /DNA_ID=CAMNT_0007124209 /DNA_START=153 /DNA_END=1451 /DNA_ORIENTATION=-
MAKKKIREYHGKRLLRKHFGKFSKLAAAKQLDIKCALVDEHTKYDELAKQEPWLLELPLVAKPDMMFGQRGKHNLVKLNASYAEAKEFIQERMNKDVTINGVTAALTHFIIEPFVPHKEEYYVSLAVEREFTKMCFSPAGGVEIEENWDKVKELHVPVGVLVEDVDLSLFEQTLGDASEDTRATVMDFLRTLIHLFDYLDFAMLEINPFAINEAGQAFPLDLVAEVDDCAHFQNHAKWGDLPFPLPFGRVLSPAETYISSLDEKTGASLKFTVLNPDGRIWNMVAGGGASVIFADTVCDLGYSHELANYGEYSGAPSEEETYLYAKTIIDLATRNPEPGKPRALLIGGGIANFTDVAVTFKGIIHALLEAKERLVAAEVRIWVRRGGVNAEQGLQIMRRLNSTLGIPVSVFGPETHMTKIVRLAVDDIFQSE